MEGLTSSAPSKGSSLNRWHEIVAKLYEHLHHIEVVSIILRFVNPEEFGIISPPVLSFLQLAPHEDGVSDYRHYTEVLRRMRDHHGLARVADVDMALWSAAQLYLEPEFAALTEASWPTVSCASTATTAVKIGSCLALPCPATPNLTVASALGGRQSVNPHRTC